MTRRAGRFGLDELGAPGWRVERVDIWCLVWRKLVVGYTDISVAAGPVLGTRRCNLDFAGGDSALSGRHH